MTANEKRQAVIDKYKTILGRNYYSQPKRNYCFRRYSDGSYYSDCSSSISYCYKEAGFGFGIMNTVDMYLSKKFTTVPVVIKKGQIQNPQVLRIGDMLLFAGSDSGRKYAGYVGHVEMVAGISGSKYTIYGHGSGRPSSKNMVSYLRSRYNTKTRTKLGNKGLIKVVRYIQDDTPADEPTQGGSAVVITGGSVNVRAGAGTKFPVAFVAHKNDRFERAETENWTPIDMGDDILWMFSKYINSAGICTGDDVNIRTGAGTEFASKKVANKGDRFSIAKVDGWVPIVKDGDMLWVSGKYVK